MIIIILAVAIAAAYLLINHPTTKLPKSVSIDTTDQPTMGNLDAKVHIVAFEDLKCHNCMRFSVSLFPTIKKKYIDTGKAKYTMINVAFINGSMPAANAARCLYKQNKKFFFPFIESIYENQPPESENWATIPKLIGFANNIKGVDKKKLSQCIYKSPYTNFINKNLQQAMKIMGGVVATPTVYINGHKVQPLTIKRIDQMMKAVS
ncbi:MAG: DsbA family protein [Coxiellaceae bacterium]|nr:DsbA family protein [Coxiellaceae bacterium]